MEHRLDERERCKGSNHKFIEKKIERKRVQKDRRKVGGIVAVRCGIMRRKITKRIRK